MIGPRDFLTNGMSGLDEGLTQSPLNSDFLSNSFESNSAFYGLKQQQRASVASDWFASQLDGLETLDTIAGNTANPSSPVGTHKSTISDSTTGKDLLTGSTENTPLVSIERSDTLFGCC